MARRKGGASRRRNAAACRLQPFKLRAASSWRRLAHCRPKPRSRCDIHTGRWAPQGLCKPLQPRGRARDYRPFVPTDSAGEPDKNVRPRAGLENASWGRLRLVGPLRLAVRRVLRTRFKMTRCHHCRMSGWLSSDVDRPNFLPALRRPFPGKSFGARPWSGSQRLRRAIGANDDGS